MKRLVALVALAAALALPAGASAAPTQTLVIARGDQVAVVPGCLRGHEATIRISAHGSVNVIVHGRSWLTLESTTRHGVTTATGRGIPFAGRFFVTVNRTAIYSISTSCG